MIRKIIESVIVESSEKVVLDFKDVFGIKNLKELRETYEISDKYSDKKLLKELQGSIEGWIEDATGDLKEGDVFASPAKITVTDGKITLADWESYDFEGEELGTASDKDIANTIKKLKHSGISEVNVYPNAVFIELNA